MSSRDTAGVRAHPPTARLSSSLPGRAWWPFGGSRRHGSARRMRRYSPRRGRCRRHASPMPRPPPARRDVPGRPSTAAVVTEVQQECINSRHDGGRCRRCSRPWRCETASDQRPRRSLDPASDTRAEASRLCDGGVTTERLAPSARGVARGTRPVSDTGTKRSPTRDGTVTRSSGATPQRRRR